ncbi:MAG TPA: chromate efflux transporter [Rhodothermales bacterium]|nr:chromate efflux transporter [Rhodothermales bacterium]
MTSDSTRGNEPDGSVHSVSVGEAFRFWLKLGFISFGGPAGQIAIMYRELVEKRQWLSEQRFLHALNYCMLLPGPEAQQLATYIGWLLHKARGGLVAGVLFVAPSVFVLLGLSYAYAAYGDVGAVAGALEGFKPVVVAIVVEAVFKIGGRALIRRVHYFMAATAFVAIYFLDVPFPLIVLAAGVAGLLGARYRPGLFDGAVTAFGNAGSRQASSAATSAPTGRPVAKTRFVIDDEGPSPDHTRPSLKRAARILSLGVILWVLPLAALTGWFGWSGLFTQEYRFFTQAALVTFGGAYAVLAYVAQAAVESFGWLTHAEAIDGLALAETTPGPLIMVVQFVGYMAAWNFPQGMSPALSGTIGALVTTYVTFLPCFLFIFLGAPFIEALRGNRSLTAILTAITASVVGVILNLALVFGAAVVWPEGFAGPVNWFAVSLSVLAFVALYRFKVDVVLVVLAGGLIGLLKALALG